MYQSDFYQKKSFANPNLFNNATTNSGSGGGAAVEKNMSATIQPQPAPGRPDVIAPTPASAAAAAAAAAATNAKDDTAKKEQEELGAGHLFKHPLQNTWTLWYLENDQTKSWEDMQNEITSFDTVEDFWSLYNHIKPPSEIKTGSDYSLFKQGIRPMWEDAANKQGGRWVISFSKILKSDLDHLWLDVLLCLIGEAFEFSEEICGAVINVRGRSNKISIWTANGSHDEAVLKIGHKLRDELRLSPNSLHYQLHKDTMVKTGSTFKSIHNL